MYMTERRNQRTLVAVNVQSFQPPILIYKGSLNWNLGQHRTTFVVQINNLSKVVLSVCPFLLNKLSLGIMMNVKDVKPNSQSVLTVYKWTILLGHTAKYQKLILSTKMVNYSQKISMNWNELNVGSWWKMLNALCKNYKNKDK